MHVSALRHPSTAVKSTVMPPSNKYAAVKPVSRCPLHTVLCTDKIPEMPELRASFSTSFAAGSLCSENRVHNITKGALLIDGSIVPAGQTFSCNDSLGVRSRENGWLPATAFANGGAETRQEYGGGICQISTTLYNAVLRSDLEIIARRRGTRARCVISAAGWMQH